MINPRHANFLRKTPSEELMDNYGDFTRGQFSKDGVPVLIAARNEQEDLPATLISLATSNQEVSPIVIENGSDDETAARAKKMGAEVLYSDAPYKLAALQTGVRMLDEENRLHSPVLFTDADTLVGKNWSAAMTRATTSPDGERPRVASGLAAFTHGSKLSVDALRTANGLAKDTLIAFGKREPTGRGHNMAIHFTSEEAKQLYAELDKRLFIAEETAIIEAIKRCGGDVVQSLGLHSLVLTRGDRFVSLKDCFAVKNDANYTERRRLYEEYGDFVPYAK